MSEPSTERACADLCTAEGEPLAGSAGGSTAWIGLSWPKPLWSPDDVLHSEGLPSDLSELASVASEQGHKLALRLFQRAPHPSREQVEMLLVRPDVALHAARVPIGSASTVARAFLRREALPCPAVPMRAELLVCTDGRHDACCARLGYPLFAALGQVRASRGAVFGLAEASHLGGHRFAANCLALPDGWLYGRVKPEQAEALVDAVLTGTSLPHVARGRLGQGELLHVAESFAHAQGVGGPQLDLSPASIESSPVDPSRARVFLDGGPRGCYWIECRIQVFQSPASCGPTAEPDARRRWVAVSLCPADRGERPGAEPSSLPG